MAAMRPILLLSCALLLARPPAAAAQEPAGADILRTPSRAQVAFRTSVRRAAPIRAADGVTLTRVPAPVDPRSRVVLLATLGSAVGLVGGALLGDEWNCCASADDLGLTSVILVAAAGSAAGAAGGAVLGGSAELPVTFGGALPGAVVGILPGLLLGYVGGRAFDVPGFLGGYALGQGVMTGAMAGTH